jgi:hypothetical protein
LDCGSLDGLTPNPPAPIIEAIVSLSLGRTIIGLLLAPAIALSATVAREHVHEADADHPRSAVHRHLQPHVGASHDHDLEHAELADDDDQHIVWLESAALDQRAFALSAPPLQFAEWSEYAPSLTDWLSSPEYDTAPPHGPPRACLSLRAPPSLPA